MSSAICFNLGQSKISSSGYGLNKLRYFFTYSITAQLACVSGSHGMPALIYADLQKKITKQIMFNPLLYSP